MCVYLSWLQDTFQHLCVRVCVCMCVCACVRSWHGLHGTYPLIQGFVRRKSPIRIIRFSLLESRAGLSERKIRLCVCNILQHTATHYSTLTYRNTLPHTTTRYKTVTCVQLADAHARRLHDNTAHRLHDNTCTQTPRQYLTRQYLTRQYLTRQYLTRQYLTRQYPPLTRYCHSCRQDKCNTGLFLHRDSRKSHPSTQTQQTEPSFYTDTAERAILLHRNSRKRPVLEARV